MIDRLGKKEKRLRNRRALRSQKSDLSAQRPHPLLLLSSCARRLSIIISTSNKDKTAVALQHAMSGRSSSRPSLFLRCHPPQHDEQSPSISTKMIKGLLQGDRVEGNAIVFLTAPKRKREDDSIGENTSWSSMKQYQDVVDGDVIYPSHKRSASLTASSTRLPLSSCDSERREGPADDASLDDETAALVSNFRTSIFREGGQVVSPPLTPILLSAVSHSPLYKESDENNNYDEHEDDSYFPEFPSLVRATTIIDPSDASAYHESYNADPPDMGGVPSRPASPQIDEIIEEDLRDHSDWSTTSSSIVYPCHGENDSIEMARDRSGFISEAGASKSTLWNISTEKDVLFWPPAAWTQIFNQENA